MIKKVLLVIIKAFALAFVVIFVKTCTKAYIKSQYEETKEKREESRSYVQNRKNNGISLVKNRLDKDSHEVINKMGKTHDIDKKLKLLVEYTSEKLPIQIDNVELFKIELLKNREVRYYNRFLGETGLMTENQWKEQRNNILNNIKYSEQFKLFRKYEVIMSYAYYTTNGKFLQLIRILPEDYR